LFHQQFCQNFTAYFRLQLLHRASYFGSFLTNAVTIEIIKNNLRKNCSALVPKMVMQLTPVGIIGLSFLKGNGLQGTMLYKNLSVIYGFS